MKKYAISLSALILLVSCSGPTPPNIVREENGKPVYSAVRTSQEYGVPFYSDKNYMVKFCPNGYRLLSTDWLGTATSLRVQTGGGANYATYGTKNFHEYKITFVCI